MAAPDDYVHWRNEERIELSLGGMSPHAIQKILGARSTGSGTENKTSASPNVENYSAIYTWDNAVMESTNRTLKKELIYCHRWWSLDQLSSELNRYVKWYNQKRIPAS